MFIFIKESKKWCHLNSDLLIQTLKVLGQSIFITNFALMSKIKLKKNEGNTLKTDKYWHMN